MGWAEIINFTKRKVLPNPESSSLTACDHNSATRVLAAAVYCQLERNYFDETCSRSDVAALFRCNTSQLSKAIMGGGRVQVGPHHYKPKKASKQKTEDSTRTLQTEKPRTAVLIRKASFYQRTH